MARTPGKTNGSTRRAVLAAMGALPLLPRGLSAQPERGQGGSAPVDLQLVLAVDASGSVSQRRFQLQWQGYVDAFRSPRVIRAIGSGLNGGIAVAMYQWTGPRMHVLSIPWRRIGDAASVESLAQAIEAVPRALFGGGTSVSGAMDYGAALFPACPWPSQRSVMDISGDGANTNGRPVRLARDEALAKGIVINGLPILAVEDDLDRYYRDEVIGGPGSFMIAARDFESFGEAVARKLVQEISAGPNAHDRG